MSIVNPQFKINIFTAFMLDSSLLFLLLLFLMRSCKYVCGKIDPINEDLYINIYMCRDMRKPALMTKNIIFSFYIYPVHQTELNKC